MESNFQKCTFLESGTGGPRTEENVYRSRAKPIGECKYLVLVPRVFCMVAPILRIPF